MGAWHILCKPSPKNLAGTLARHPFKAWYHYGSCINQKDAVRGCGGALPVPTTTRHMHGVQGPRMPISNVLLHYVQ